MIQGLVFVDQIKKELPPRRFTQTVNRSIETSVSALAPARGIIAKPRRSCAGTAENYPGVAVKPLDCYRSTALAG